MRKRTGETGAALVFGQDAFARWLPRLTRSATSGSVWITPRCSARTPPPLGCVGDSWMWFRQHGSILVLGGFSKATFFLRPRQLRPRSLRHFSGEGSFPHILGTEMDSPFAHLKTSSKIAAHNFSQRLRCLDPVPRQRHSC